MAPNHKRWENKHQVDWRCFYLSLFICKKEDFGLFGLAANTSQQSRNLEVICSYRHSGSTSLANSILFACLFFFSILVRGVRCLISPQKTGRTAFPSRCSRTSGQSGSAGSHWSPQREQEPQSVSCTEKQKIKRNTQRGGWDESEPIEPYSQETTNKLILNVFFFAFKPT